MNPIDFNAFDKTLANLEKAMGLNPPKLPRETNRVWLRLTTSRHHTIKSVLVEAGRPDLTGFVKIDESIVNQNAFLNNGVVAQAFFRQGEGKPIGKGDIWALVDFPT